MIVSGNCRTAVGRSAVGHLAAILHGSYPIILAPDAGAGKDLVHGGPAFAEGKFRLGAGPGLDVALDEKALGDTMIVERVET